MNATPEGNRSPSSTQGVQRGPAWLAFLKYAGIAGMGWTLDGCILLVLVSATGMLPAAANVISSCTAALTVFLISRRAIFDRAEGQLAMRILAYLAYTLLVIFAASAILGALVPLLRASLANYVESRWAQAYAILLAKVIVTPPQLFLNFLVSRFFSERSVGLSA